MDESQRILAKQRGLKSSVTKLLGKIEDMTSVEIEHVSSESVTESRRLTVTTILTQIRGKRDQISGLDIAIVGKAQTAEELEEEICNADTYQTTLEERIAFLTEFIRKSSLTPVRPPPPPSREAHPRTETSDTEPAATDTHPAHVSATDTHTHDSTPSSIYHNASRLPKLTLSTFNGDPLQWETFWDSFDAAVNSSTGLSNVQKFTYLRAEVHGEAARVIAGFPLTNSNYTHSIPLLRERFGQTYKIVNAHTEVLLNLGKPANTLSSLQVFHDSIEQHMRALSG